MQSKKPQKKTKNRFPGFDLVTTPESGVTTFGTNVWFRKEPIGVIIVFPTGQTLKILPEDEIKISNENLIKEYLMIPKAR